MSGETYSGNETSVLQNRWGGADGGDPVTVSALPANPFDWLLVCPQVLHPGAAGKYEAIEVAFQDRGQGGVGDNANSVSPRDS